VHPTLLVVGLGVSNVFENSVSGRASVRLVQLQRTPWVPSCFGGRADGPALFRRGVSLGKLARAMSGQMRTPDWLACFSFARAAIANFNHGFMVDLTIDR